MCLQFLFITQTLRWLPLCVGHMVIIPSFCWLSAMELIFYFTDMILGTCWLSQNRVDRFIWMSFILLFSLDDLVPERFVNGYLCIFGGLICCPENRLYLIMLFVRRINPLHYCNLVCCSHYLFQKASFCTKVLTLLWTCLFFYGNDAILPLLAS